jgi:hypothetical protein
MLRGIILTAGLLVAVGAEAEISVKDLRPPRAPAALIQEWLQVAEGPLTGVFPETEMIRIDTTHDGPLDFRYGAQTKVEGAQEDVIDCFSQSERRARVHFRMADGIRTAVRIELLTQAASDSE